MRVVGFFCEDIRSEAAGTESIIGVLPDNLTVSSVPGAIAKLAGYFRVQFDLDEAPNSLEMTLKTPWGETVSLGKADKKLFDEAIQGALANKLPLAGIILRVILAPFPVKDAGLITATAIVDGKEQTCAMLNIKLPDSPTASPPPS